MKHDTIALNTAIETLQEYFSGKQMFVIAAITVYSSQVLLILVNSNSEYINNLDDNAKVRYKIN